VPNHIHLFLILNLGLGHQPMELSLSNIALARYFSNNPKTKPTKILG
jgi:hypothetical protein